MASDASFADCPRPDIVCVTDLLLPPGATLGDHYDAEVRWPRGLGRMSPIECIHTLRLEKPSRCSNPPTFRWKALKQQLRSIATD